MMPYVEHFRDGERDGGVAGIGTLMNHVEAVTEGNIY